MRDQNSSAVGPDLDGEDDTEPGDGGFELGPGAVLEGELALERARHAGREQRPLVRLGQSPKRGEGVFVFFLLQPVERKARAVGQQALAGAVLLESIVVHAQRGPVQGLPDGDIERIGLIAAGEHGTAHLEQQEIEGGLEVPGEMRLDQRGADGPQIVGEPDADARFLARLGAGVGRRCRRAGQPRRLKGAVLAFAVVRFGAVRGALALGHVLGADEALDEAQFAILADGCDAPPRSNGPPPGTRPGLRATP